MSLIGAATLHTALLALLMSLTILCLSGCRSTGSSSEAPGGLVAAPQASARLEPLRQRPPGRPARSDSLRPERAGAPSADRAATHPLLAGTRPTAQSSDRDIRSVSQTADAADPLTTRATENGSSEILPATYQGTAEPGTESDAAPGVTNADAEQLNEAEAPPALAEPSVAKPSVLIPYRDGRPPTGEPLQWDDSDLLVPPGEPDGITPDTSMAPNFGIDVADSLHLEEVIGSVYSSYPLLEAALFQRNIAAGEQLAAAGSFDLKLKAETENGPTSFYPTSRNSVGLSQPLMSGGEVYGGYRIGRGSFEPWYQERQTNSGGELKAGLIVPFSRNVRIDPARAELWRASYERQRVEPEIQEQLIEFVREATMLYWDWVGAGQSYRIQSALLEFARTRNAGLRVQVEVGDKDPPDLIDNERLILSREAKVLDAARKLQQTAAKLSLYLRTEDGNPRVPPIEHLPSFPEFEPYAIDQLETDLVTAIANRPELAQLDVQRRQLDVDYAEANNEFRPSLNGTLSGSQDLGGPTSSKKDKSEFELEAGLYFDLSLQRRKARGKLQAVEAKLAQVALKRRMTEDKITVEVQSAYADLLAAQSRIDKARQARQLAERMAQIERTKFEEGTSDLLSVNLREQQAAEAAETEVNTILEYYYARADLRATLALDGTPDYWPQ